MACNGCQGRGLRALVSRKLGRCPKCMRLSALGALIGWIACAGVYFVFPNPALLGLTLFVATSFSLLWISHTVAFTIRVGSALKEDRVGNEKPNLSRREFVPALGRYALFGALVSLGLWRPLKASLAQGGFVNCCIQHCCLEQTLTERQCLSQKGTVVSGSCPHGTDCGGGFCTQAPDDDDEPDDDDSEPDDDDDGE